MRGCSILHASNTLSKSISFAKLFFIDMTIIELASTVDNEWRYILIVSRILENNIQYAYRCKMNRSDLPTIGPSCLRGDSGIGIPRT